MSGLFGTLNIGKSGLFANQRAIDVTGHNIANTKTEGYSRQRAELVTRRPFCTPSMNNAAEPGQLGTGVEVSQIARIRDTFLDYQVRTEMGTQGRYQGRDKFLTEIEGLLNEPSDTGLSTLFGKFFDSWQQFSKQPESSNTRTMVAEQSNALASELNHTYSQLNKIKGNAQDLIKQTVFDVNNKINQVNQLNQEIIQISVAGNNANDLMDRRDLLLDQLSSNFGITIDKKNFDAIELNTKEDKDAGAPKGVNLVQVIDPDKVARFAYIQDIQAAKDDKGNPTGKYDIVYYKNGDTTTENNRVVIKDVELTAEQKREMDECRVLWTDKDGNLLKKDGEAVNADKDGISGIKFSDMALFKPSSGEFKGYMSVQQDVDSYMDKTNNLAKALAFAVNTIHGQSTDSSKDELPFFVNKDGDEVNIDASNIVVNKKIMDNPMLIKGSKLDVPPSGESDGKRALAIAGLKDVLMGTQNINSNMSREDFINKFCGGLKENEYGIKVLNGTTDGMKIDNYFKDMVDTLGIQEQEARRMVKNQKDLLNTFTQSRASVSGVSLDEEMTNLVQFQHAYVANSKIISTVDELLDVIINGLKR